MSHLTILDNIRIAFPCEADWNAMIGDDRSRLCASCSHQVHNIAAMTAEEATRLILEHEGRLCVQIYRRRDGTVMTSDCPVGIQALSRSCRVRRVLALSLIILPVVVVAGWASAWSGRRQFDPLPSGPGVTWNDRFDWALVTLGLRSNHSCRVRGELRDEVIYDPPGPEFSYSNPKAVEQRAKMQAAGIPVPELPAEKIPKIIEVRSSFKGVRAILATQLSTGKGRSDEPTDDPRQYRYCFALPGRVVGDGRR